MVSRERARVRPGAWSGEGLGGAEAQVSGADTLSQAEWQCRSKEVATCKSR